MRRSELEIEQELKQLEQEKRRIQLNSGLFKKKKKRKKKGKKTHRK